MQQYNQLLNQQWANYLANWNNMYWANYPQFAQAAAQQMYDNYNGYGYNYGDSGEQQNTNEQENEFGISENAIMQKAEAEARKHVEAKMEKQLEAKLESQMMGQLNHGGGLGDMGNMGDMGEGGGNEGNEGPMFGGNSHGYVHQKHGQYGEMGEHEDDGGNMDAEHSGMPMDEMDGEDDQMQGPPHDSLSAEAEN